MDLSVVFLGTGGSVPSARRSTASVLVARGGERLLFDCGEGTQRQLQRSLGLVQVDEIYLTHFHADHILGLPGLLKTYDLTDREQAAGRLRAAGPAGAVPGPRPADRAARLPSRAGRAGARRGGRRTTATRCSSFEVAHGVRASGYALVEAERPGRFDPAAALAAGVPEGPAFAALQRGEEVRGGAGPVSPEQVMGPSRAGRTIVITGDTAPSPATVAAAADAELLIHDASFAEEEAQRAAETGHSTVGQAAAVGAEAHVKLLALVHISSRYHVGKVLEEAEDVFAPGRRPPRFRHHRDPLPRARRTPSHRQTELATTAGRGRPLDEPPHLVRGEGPAPSRRLPCYGGPVL